MEALIVTDPNGRSSFGRDPLYSLLRPVDEDMEVPGRQTRDCELLANLGEIWFRWVQLH